MEILNSAVNYHETLKADFFEQFLFIDDIRTELDAWEKLKLKAIVIQGIQSGEFKTIQNMDILLEILIMIMKGLEIPFFVQNKYERYSPHFDGLIRILTKGLQ